MSQRSVTILEPAQATISLNHNGFVADHSQDLNAHVQISEMLSDVYKSNPSRFPNLTENQVREMLENIFDKFDKSLRVEQKLELISKLLTKTMNSGRMGIDNYLPGENANGTLSIMHNNGNGSVLSILSDLNPADFNKTLASQGHTFSQFFTSYVQDLANPEGVDQGINNTCSVTCSQMHQLAEDPATLTKTFADLITKGISSNKGDSGARLTETFATRGRSLASSLIQCSMMNIIGYDPASDLTFGSTGQHPGLFSGQLWEVLCKSTGKPWQIAYEQDGGYRSIINTALDQRKGLILVAEGIGEGAHAWHDIRLIDLKADPNDGKEYAYFMNPWPDNYLKEGSGIEIINKQTGLCRMSADVLLSNTKYIAYETSDAADMQRPPANYDEIEYGRDMRFSAPVFTVEAYGTEESDSSVDLRLLKKISDSLKSSDKKEDNLAALYEKLRKKFLRLEEV